MSQENLDPPIEELMNQLIPQARAVAWRHWHGAPYVLEFDELVSLANKGLVEARARWEQYCADHGYDPARTRYFAAYCLRRMNGSIQDYMRSQDWVTRTVRNRVRSLRDAGMDQGRSEAELAVAADMTREQVADTLAAMARKPVEFDPVEHDMRDIADTESHAVVDDLLSEATRVMGDLQLPVQFVLVLTFYHGLSVRQAADALGLAVNEVTNMQQEGVLAVHRALAYAAKDR